MDIHTDLAMELSHRVKDNGVSVEEREEDGAQITLVRVQNEKGALKIGKPVGRYITVYSKELCEKDPEGKKKLSFCIAKQLKLLLPPLTRQSQVLVLGLGNRAITPDALGSKTAGKVLVSRHIIENLPDVIDKRVKSVCAISPGVLGITGLETGEVALGIIEKVRPTCVVAIDSLAALSLKRVLTTVQLCDAGIHPGSGLNNPRREITQSTMGVPVIALGVPLVVSALSICRDALEQMDNRSPDMEKLQSALGEEVADMVVTPRNIDEAVDNAASVIAMAINLAVHEDIGYDEFATMLS